MKARFEGLWDKAAAWIVGLTVLVGVLGISDGLYTQHQSNDRGSTDHQILTTLSHEVRILEAGATRHTAEIAALNKSNIVLDEIFAAAAVRKRTS